MKIEKNIPIPLKRSKLRDILNQMDVGDSVLLDTRSECVAMRHSALSLGFTVTTRTIDDKIRFWRTS